MYVLEATGSAAVFAWILSAATVPTVVPPPLGGIAADRADRRNIMVALDLLAGLSVLCSALAAGEGCGLAAIGVLIVTLSVLGAFETPTVQVCIPTMLKGDNIVKGNAVVNQVASLSSFVAPMLGGMLYTALGLKTVMYASAACFFLTALFECFIKLDYQRPKNNGSVLSIVKKYFVSTMRYFFKERTDISRMLLLAAFSRFFVMGIVTVGLPYIVRTVLKLSAQYCGAAESALAVAAILGSSLAGLLTTRLRIRSL